MIDKEKKKEAIKQTLVFGERFLSFQLKELENISDQKLDYMYNAIVTGGVEALDMLKKITPADMEHCSHSSKEEHVLGEALSNFITSLSISFTAQLMLMKKEGLLNTEEDEL